jgi:MFS family permease
MFFSLSRDGWLLFSTRLVRLFAYGFLSVVLVLYLSAVGINTTQIGLLLTLTMLGDAAISLWITTSADRIGRKKMLILGAGLMILAGVIFIATGNVIFLTIAAIIGVISPSGSEVGPFLSIEQAALSQIVPNERRTRIFAWYNLVGSFATALGALAGGTLAQGLQNLGYTALDSYRFILLGYAAAGTLLIFLFSWLSSAIEVSKEDSAQNATKKTQFGLHRSRSIVFKLSALFALDAFGGWLVVQSLMAYWLHLRFGLEPAALGGVFFAANILAGCSALAAVWLAERIGLINTMVWTHIPSNILLILFPFMPNATLAIILLLARHSISQMDVPTRQSYTMAVVAPDERSAASGVTNMARSIGSSLAPALTGALLSAQLLKTPFVLAGVLKIVYDLLLYKNFRALKPPEEEG